jgi:hypothetical protein
MPLLFGMAIAATPTQAGIGAALLTAIFESATKLPIQIGGFFGHEANLPSGRAVVLDLDRAPVKNGVLEIPTAIGTAFAAQIAQLARDYQDRSESLVVEVRLPSGSPDGLLKPGALSKALGNVLEGRGMDLSILKRVRFGVLSENPEAIRARLAELSSGHRVQVITDREGVPFWAGLGVTLSVLVAFLNALVVETEVVLTGDLAEMARREGLGEKEGENVRLKALKTPLQALEGAAETEALIRLQA